MTEREQERIDRLLKKMQKENDKQARWMARFLKKQAKDAAQAAKDAEARQAREVKHIRFLLKMVKERMAGKW